ncbi:MAG: hypothetical protein IPH91_09700 [Elusimicrobia bacterium]|nr:hypothetical protein [Elusimicrobiota bacterium]
MKFKISFGVLHSPWRLSVPPGNPTFFDGDNADPYLQRVLPFWTFADTQDQDLISIHGDDFWVFLGSIRQQQAPPGPLGPTMGDHREKRKGHRQSALPGPFALGGRKTLTKSVTAAGTYNETWAPVDADGCYPFSTDVNADTHRRAYVAYASYLIDLVQPRYFSPVIEMDIQFSTARRKKTLLSPGTARCIGRSKPGTRR